MKAMILAAGRGMRLRPETDATPKPLLDVGGEPLIAHHLRKLAIAGCSEVVINTGWLGEQLPEALGNGSAWGLQIHYSPEGWPALETGGGIFKALSLLGEEAFLLVNGDVWSDCDYAALAADYREGDLGHLLLVPSPAHNPQGDFSLHAGRLGNAAQARVTYSGLAVLHPRLFDACTPGAFPLAPLLRDAAERGGMGGRLHDAFWSDIGTPERLAAIRNDGARAG